MLKRTMKTLFQTLLLNINVKTLKKKGIVQRTHIQILSFLCIRCLHKNKHFQKQKQGLREHFNIHFLQYIFYLLSSEINTSIYKRLAVF